MWQIFRSQDVCHGSKGQRTGLLHQTKCRFPSDMLWWRTFMVEWNGLSLLRSKFLWSLPDYCIQTDASGSWGCGAFLEGEWFQWQWPQESLEMSIMAKELVPITLSCAVWGPKLAKRRVLFQCDNLSLVNAISKGSSREKEVMHLLRYLWFFVAYFDINLHAKHIAGAVYTTADQLSRNHMKSFFSSHPQVSLLPTPLPPALLQLMSSPEIDWISPRFNEMFRDTITWVQHSPHGSLTRQGTALSEVLQFSQEGSPSNYRSYPPALRIISRLPQVVTLHY